MPKTKGQTKLYLAPDASLELMRYLRSINGDEGIGGMAVRKREQKLNDAINTVGALNELDYVAQRWLEHVGNPVHAYVSDKAKGTKTNRLITHVLSSPPQSGCFLDLGHNVRICTPQFVFMQEAAQQDLVDTVRIGMELCGYYSQWRLEPHVMFDPYYQEYMETRSCTFDLPAVAKAVRLQGFVDRLSGRRGAVGARAALRWVLDCSASPMETAVYLLLCLPKRLGGYGLPKPVLNPKIMVYTPDGMKERYPDLFWHGPNIDVEYNSDTSHGGEWSRYKDSKREVELVVSNVKVLPLTRQQLMNADEFDAFANGLRIMLGLRTRSAGPEWLYRRNELRRKLLADWN